MFKNANKKFSQNMKRLLKIIKSGQPLPELSEYDKQCLEECIKLGYISGMIAARNLQNEVIFSCPNPPKMEKAGLEFLYPKVNWVLILSFIAALGTIFTVIDFILKIF